MNLQELQQPQVRQWIKAHERDEAALLMLQAKQFPDIPLREAVQQIQARQKARHKLPHWYAQEEVLMPPPLSVEQASSEETALYKAKLMQQRYIESDRGTEAGTLADLTGGMGLDSWAFSHFFNTVHYVEQQEILAALAVHNFSALQRSNIQVHAGSAAAFLEQVQQPLSVIYLDPARRDAASKKVVLLSESEPDVVKLLPLLLQKARQLWIKASPMLDIKGAMQELGQRVAEVQVLSVKGEVKELLFRLENQLQENPLITAVNMTADGRQELYQFHYADEAAAAPPIGPPRAYLYDPGAALRKAGAFRLPALRFGLQKLHPHSHLYTADVLLEDFPGRTFKVLELLKADKKAVRRQLPEGKAHLVVRNFPQKAEVLQKKLSIAEGDPYYLFATTLADGKPQLLLCERC